MGISTSTYIKNFVIIFLTLISMFFILFISQWLLGYIMVYIEKFTNFITNKFILKLRWKYLLAFCETNIIIAPIVILSISRKYLGELSLFVFFFYILILSSITIYIRKGRGNTFSLLEYIYVKINKGEYFINRINLLFDQGLSIIILIIAFEFTILIFTQLEWPAWLQYIAFVAPPIYLNIWIYIQYNFKLNDIAIIKIRRIIIYILLAVYVLGDCYSKFYSVVYYNTSPRLELSNLFIYIISASFIALERVMKTITDDFEDFRRKANSN